MIPAIPSETYFPGRKGSPVQGGMAIGTGLVIPEDEQEKLKWISGMFAQAAQYRARWDKHWPRFWQLWEGNHYYGKTVYTLTRAVINQIFSTVETFVGHVADTMAPPSAYARRAELREKAKTVTKWLQTEWDKSGAEYQIQTFVRSAAVCGVGWVEIPWDASRSDGKGGVGYIPKDERFMFISPEAKNLNEALYLIEASNVPREFVENTWEKGAEVPPGIWMPQVNNTRAYTNGSPDMDNITSFLTTDGSQSGTTNQTQNEQGTTSKSMVTLLKCYIRQKDGGMRLIIIANGLILQDGPSPYDDDEFPYVMLNLIPTLDTAYGRSLVQFVESLQEVIDCSLSYLLDVQRFAADPMLGVSSLNLEEGQIVENVPGAILPDMSLGSGNGQGFYWLNGPGFNQSWMQILESVIGAMDSVLGRVDVLKGERPAGVNTLGGLEIIRDEANVRVRNLVRWVRKAVKESYLLMLSRLRQFVHDEQVLRVPSKRGEEDYITVNPEVGQTLEGQPIQDKTIPDDAEFELDFGPEEPGGEQAKREFVLTLLTTPAEDGKPLVTRKWALDKLDIQEKDEILQEIQAASQAEAEAMAAQEAAAGGQQAAADPVAEDPMRAISALFEGA